MKHEIPHKLLEALIIETKKNGHKGQANFVFVKKVEGNKEFVFRVVCEMKAKEGLSR